VSDAKTGTEAATSKAELVKEVSPTAVIPGGTAEYRDQLVKRYHGGASSLVQRLRKSGATDNESLLIALIDEVVRETDNLLGNGLIATESGNVEASSVISFKRAEVLEKAIKAVQSKQQFEKESGVGVDVDSPSMVVIFTYFMTKVKDVFERMEMPDEQRDIFFQTLGEQTENWKRELREKFEAAKSR
jgi:hypothetical protein